MRRVVSWPIVALAFASSLWIRLAFPVYGMGFSSYDDLLFLRLADAMLQTGWLGGYDNLTLAKGAAYSGFIAAAYRLHLPLKLAEHVVYLLCSLYFSVQVGAKLRSRTTATVLFALLAFNPLFWTSEVGGRIVRENLYVSLAVLMVGLGIRVFMREPAATVRDEIDRNRGALVALGVAGGVFWLTREEGVWLAPTMLILAAYGVSRQILVGAVAARLSIILGVPALSFFAIVGAVDTMNLAKYGVYRNNDFRSEDFQSAYGALARIKHDHWRNYVIFPTDARRRAYSVSAAARELEPAFEGQMGANWQKVSCEQTGGAYCDEIHSGWFMWMLRSAVAEAGHYRSAPDTQGFYRRLAREIDDACDRGAIECGPVHHTLVPPWRWAFIPLLGEALPRLFTTAVKLGEPVVHIGTSVGTRDQLALYERLTRGRLAVADDPAAHGFRFLVATWMSRLLVAVCAVAIPVALIAWFVLLAKSRGRPLSDHVLVSALVAAMGMRIALLTFLEATSIPSNNALYASPVIPFELAIVPCIALLAARIIGARMLPFGLSTQQGD